MIETNKEARKRIKETWDDLAWKNLDLDISKSMRENIITLYENQKNHVLGYSPIDSSGFESIRFPMLRRCFPRLKESTVYDAI